MKVFGITGGVGAGKSEVLTYLGQNYDATVIQADEARNSLSLWHPLRSGSKTHGYPDTSRNTAKHGVRADAEGTA